MNQQEFIIMNFIDNYDNGLHNIITQLNLKCKMSYFKYEPLNQKYKYCRKKLYFGIDMKLKEFNYSLLDSNEPENYFASEVKYTIEKFDLQL